MLENEHLQNTESVKLDENQQIHRSEHLGPCFVVHVMSSLESVGS